MFMQKDFKYKICEIYFYNANNVIKASINIVTIVDLLTQVAGVPSFLLLISKVLLHRFEYFYTDLKIYQSFSQESESQSPQDPSNKGSSSKPTNSSKLKHKGSKNKD